MSTKLKHVLGATSLAAIVALCAGSGGDVQAQALQSRLFDITKNKKLRVCQYPLYYSISYRDPTTGQLTGIDVDLSKELAKELGAGPEAARDVGQAMAKNPVPLIIPCHRVLAAGGKVGGFSAPGGSAAKIRMLELEGVHVAPLQSAQQSLGL